MKLFKKIKKTYQESNKKIFIVYIVLRTLVLLLFIRQIMNREWGNALICLYSLFLFTIPFFIERKFKVSIPTGLEILILCFIFSAEILGELNSFYIRIPHFDTLMHTINGFVCAGIGFSLVDLLNEHSDKFNLSPLFVSIVAFCFSMTVGVLWEFAEFSCDQILKVDMQKDAILKTISTVELDTSRTNKSVVVKNIDKMVLYGQNNQVLAEFPGYLDVGIIDTMKDLIVNFVGALVFSIIGYLYIKNREKYKFIDNLLLTKKIKVIEE